MKTENRNIFKEALKLHKEGWLPHVDDKPTVKGWIRMEGMVRPVPWSIYKLLEGLCSDSQSKKTK